MNQLSDSEKIEILIDQVGRMTESITELRMSVERGFSEVRSQFTELKTVSERQERNIERLVGAVEGGFSEVRSQFTELKTVSERQERNIERQERNIDRLIGVVEALIQSQHSGS